ncbi:MAG: hypothetical protein PHI58_04860 [Candidatus Omnitrophica bacterium]|nr:hypothetical protein [Candidatus Omnitrophota bacterium]
MILLAAIIFIAGTSYASDYKGVEKQGTIFQKLGDLITGNYEVEKGKTLKEKGVANVAVEQIKEIKSGPVR